MKKLAFVLIALIGILFSAFVILRNDAKETEAKIQNHTWVTCHKETGDHCSQQQFLNHCAPTWSRGACPEPEETCEDETATNFGKEGECEYETLPSVIPSPVPPVLCEDQTALNYKSAGDCRYVSAASAPQAPACEHPIYAPTLSFNGKEFGWTTVKDNLHTYWMNYGPTKDSLPYSVIVQGENFKPNVEWKGQIWAQVAGYDNGCLGPFSLTVDP